MRNEEAWAGKTEKKPQPQPCSCPTVAGPAPWHPPQRLCTAHVPVAGPSPRPRWSGTGVRLVPGQGARPGGPSPAAPGPGRPGSAPASRAGCGGDEPRRGGGEVRPALVGGGGGARRWAGFRALPARAGREPPRDRDGTRGEARRSAEVLLPGVGGGRPRCHVTPLLTAPRLEGTGSLPLVLIEPGRLPGEPINRIQGTFQIGIPGSGDRARQRQAVRRPTVRGRSAVLFLFRSGDEQPARQRRVPHRERFTPFQPHRANAGAARTSPGRYHNRVFNHCVEQQN